MAEFTYQPSVIEPKWQEIWAERRTFTTPSDPAELALEAQVLRPRHVPLPLRRRPPRRPPRGLHRHRHRRPHEAHAGLQRPPPDGLGRLRSARRARRGARGPPPGRDHRAQHRHLPPPDQAPRLLLRLGPRGQHLRAPTTTAGPSGSSSSSTRRASPTWPTCPVNWCPALGTVLANEEVKDGAYVETGDPVERRLMRQWMLKITDYAERLLDDLDGLDWPESVKEMQRNWIGKSHGADVVFRIAGTDQDFTVFTTRPDTLFGATYCVLAPEHPLVAEITTDEQRAAVEAYVDEAAQKSDLDRTDLAKEKTGVFTGAYAVNPVNDEQIPIWVADYVLMGYGTGAIMAVPGHDERDHEFAREFDLPIIEVVSGRDVPIEEAAYTDNVDGVLVNSTGKDGFSIDGLKVPDAIAKITAWLDERGLGEGRVQYRLRDWLFSRQRYWGEPFPVVHTDDGEVVALARETGCRSSCPPIDEYRPTDDGRPPLARAGDDWLRVELPDGRDGHPRDQHHAAVGRLLLVLPALSSTRTTTSEPWSTGGRELLDARRSLRRRRRARRAPPALRPLLAQGALRLRLVSHQGAVPEALQPGHDPRLLLPRRERQVLPPVGRRRSGTAHVFAKARRHRARGPDREDVQVQAQRRQPRRRHRRVRRRRHAAVRALHGPARGPEAVADEGRRGRQPLPATGLAAGRRREDRRAQPEAHRRAVELRARARAHPSQDHQEGHVATPRPCR